MSNTKAPIKNYKLYNQSLIAKQIGISQSYVSRVMRGITKNDKVLKRILAVINSNNIASELC